MQINLLPDDSTYYLISNTFILHTPPLPTSVRSVLWRSHVQPDGFGGRSPAHRAYYFGREIERWAEYRGALAAYEINFFTGKPVHPDRLRPCIPTGRYHWKPAGWLWRLSGHLMISLWPLPGSGWLRSELKLIQKQRLYGHTALMAEITG